MINRVTDGAEAVVNTDGSDLRISNLLLVATEDGSAVVVGHIVNRAEEADQILGITVGGVGATLTGKTKLDTNQPIHFEGELANAKAVFAGVGAVPGRNVDLTIGFARAGLVTVRAIIRDKRDIYADVTSGAKLVTPAATTK
jgi:Flp pilus assembly CpaE family ATPase